jgi:hypothetical protein
LTSCSCCARKGTYVVLELLKYDGDDVDDENDDFPARFVDVDVVVLFAVVAVVAAVVVVLKWQLSA